MDVSSTEIIKNNSELKQEIEKLNQKLYDITRQLKTAHSLEKDYKDEILALQKGTNSASEKLEKDVQKLKDKLSTTSQELIEQSSNFIKELQEKNDEIQALRRELATVVGLSKGAPAGGQDDAKLLAELAESRAENVELNVELEELTTNYFDFQAKSNTTIKCLSEQLKEEQELRAAATARLREAGELTETLRLEQGALQAELEAARLRPLGSETRGNSLFGEVDDRRLELQNSLQVMKRTYMEMRRDHAQLLERIEALRVENAQLVAKRQEEINEKEYENYTMLEERQNQIDDLKLLVESYRKQLSEKSVDYLGFDAFLKIRDKEFESIREQFELKSSSVSSLSTDLVHANREIRYLKLEVQRLQSTLAEQKAKIDELQQQIADLNVLQNTICIESNEIDADNTINEMIKPKPILKGARGNNVLIDLTNELEENENQGVRFTNDTIEPKVTDRVAMRKRNCIILKPTHIPPSS